MSISDQLYTYSLVLLLLHRPWPLSVHISPFSCCFTWPCHFYAMRWFLFTILINVPPCLGSLSNSCLHLMWKKHSRLLNIAYILRESLGEVVSLKF